MHTECFKALLFCTIKCFKLLKPFLDFCLKIKSVYRILNNNHNCLSSYSNENYFSKNLNVPKYPSLKP